MARSSTATLVLTGLQELRQALLKLPTDLRNEAAVIVNAHADEAARRIVAAYPTGPTGNLKAGVTVTYTTEAYTAHALVVSAARHAWLYEHGSQVRHTALGVSRGAMPPQPTVIPINMQQRRMMYAAINTVLEKAGLQVSGDLWAESVGGESPRAA